MNARCVLQDGLALKAKISDNLEVLFSLKFSNIKKRIILIAH